MILWVDIESLGEEVYRGVVVFCGEGLVALGLEFVCAHRAVVRGGYVGGRDGVRVKQDYVCTLWAL